MSDVADPLDGLDTVRINGPLVRFAMRCNGLSQAEMARRLGVNESTVSRMLDGATSARVDTARKIAAQFPGLTAREVFDLIDPAATLPPGAAADVLPAAR